jgi:hypothetical protein
VIIRPEVDQLIRGEIMQQWFLTEATARRQHPLGGERDADGHFLGRLWTVNVAER